MKTLLLLLTTITTFAQSDTITLNKPLLLQPHQVKEIYKGLKQGEQYKFIAKENEQITFTLHNVIKQQNDSLKTFIMRLNVRNTEIDYLQSQKENAIREVERLKATKPKWYRSPFLWGGVGLISGILITK